VADSSEKKLNPEQVKAIKHSSGPLLIIAGAGTGKTTVITERVRFLISEKSVSPSEILALTFTEKAAKEMEERVDEKLPLGYANLWISTFHAFSDRVLRNEALNIGLNPKYRVMTQAENIQFLRKNLFKFELDYFRPLGNPNKFLEGLLQHFSRLKDEDVSTEEYFKYFNKISSDYEKNENLNSEEKAVFGDELKKTEELVKAYQKYEELKIKEGLFDFSDLIDNVLKIFRARPGILDKYRKMFKYILIDEFQDTNFAQYSLIKLLVPPPKSNLTVVGDDNQSIYKFRGAAISNIMQFNKDYKEAKNIILNKNYRSSQTILDSAYKLIKNNDPDTLEARLGISKKLVKMRDVEETPVEFLFSDRVEDEAELVAREIRRLTDSYPYKDFAVLIRANSHAEPFIRAFTRVGIPSQFLGPSMLFRQPEVKDLISYLYVLENFEDSVSMYRLLSMSYFGIHGRDLALLLNFSRKKRISLFEACEEVVSLNEPLLSEESKGKIKRIIQIIHNHLNLAKTETAGQILYYFLEETGYLRRLSSYQNPDDEKKAQNISKFFEKIKSFEAGHEDASVFAVVDYINLCLELGESPLANDTDWSENNAVNILTVHSAKGLEFPVVFLVNLVAQRFPTTERHEQIPIPEALIKETLPEGDFHLQEERRLCYVGMTRARDKLFFTASKYYGEGKREKKTSPFVAEALGEVLTDSKIQEKKQLFLFETKNIKKEPPKKDLRHFSNTLSYSQLDTYATCSLKYKYCYILNLPSPSSAALSFGSTIHETLCDFYQKAMAGQNPDREILLKTLAENWKPFGFSSKEHQEKYKKEGERILTEFFEKSYDPKNLPLALEVPFVVKISESLKISGKIDRIDKTSKGIEVIDYKTGKSVTQKDVDKDLQLTLYALAIKDGNLKYLGVEDDHNNEVKVSFYFLNSQKKVSSVKSPEELGKAKEEVLKKVEEIESSDFSPNPGWHCDFCEFKMLCEAWS